MVWAYRLSRSLVALALLTGSAAAWAGTINATDGVAISGYDPVAYFTQGRAVRGDPAISAVHAGATYYFTSEADRAQFATDPIRYIPQFGGFCAFGTSQGPKATIDPEAFTIVNGKLYLNYNKDVWTKFKEDPAFYIQKADANWPEVQRQPDPTD